MAAIDEAVKELQAIRDDLRRNRTDKVRLQVEDRIGMLELSVGMLTWHIEALIKGVTSGRPD